MLCEGYAFCLDAILVPVQLLCILVELLICNHFTFDLALRCELACLDHASQGLLYADMHTVACALQSDSHKVVHYICLDLGSASTTYSQLNKTVLEIIILQWSPSSHCEVLAWYSVHC